MTRESAMAMLRWQSLAKLALVLLLIVGANILAGRMTDALDVDVRPMNEDLVHRLVMTAAVVYAALIAIPFVPGVEVGWAIITVLGPKIVPLIYFCTIAGLGVAYVFGRLVSMAWLAETFAGLHLTRAANLLRTVEPMSAQDRLGFLLQRAPTRVLPLLLRHRYLSLGILINLPGNFLLGGGGGIGLVAGMTGLFSPMKFLLTIAIAVAPLPIAIFVLGGRLLAP